MDDLLLEITEVLKEAEELINKRNLLMGWKGNRIINASIDSDGVKLLMYNQTNFGGIVTKSQPQTCDLDGSTYRFVEEHANGVRFSSIENLGGDEDAKLAF